MELYYFCGEKFRKTISSDVIELSVLTNIRNKYC